MVRGRKRERGGIFPFNKLNVSLGGDFFEEQKDGLFYMTLGEFS